jgi:mannose-6-phosphate isomerase-like protein (cupin superfamily)
MRGYVGPIESLSEANSDFRRVLYTADHMQLVLMVLKPGEDIGTEVHETHDQFFRIEKGHGEIQMDDEKTPVASGDAIVVPAGTRHNLVNTGSQSLLLYTLYSPPQHADGLVEATRTLAERHDSAGAATDTAERSRNARTSDQSPVARPLAGSGS